VTERPTLVVAVTSAWLLFVLSPIGGPQVVEWLQESSGKYPPGCPDNTNTLSYFADQPLLAHPDVTDRHLVVYAFEDFLKKWFFNVLQILEVLSHDTLPYVRMKALDATFSLLAGNAEQEQNLLRLGVNKLGDTDRSVASKVSHHILQLLQVHPAMKTVIAREVTAIVLKTVLTGAAGSSAAGAHMRFDDGKDDKKDKDKDVSTHGRYYGLITLNQMTLTSKDKEVAGKLVEVYFEVFREILGDEQSKGEDKETGEKVTEKVTGKVEKWRGRKKGAKPKGGRKTATEDELVESADAKLVAAVLTGINRALPFAKIDDALFTNYMDTLFKICHGGTFNTSIQALQLIFQVCQSRQTVNDRFYRTLYESLFDPRLLTSSKQAMYLNLLFKALKVDPSLPRVMAFVKRLLQMLGVHQPPFICGALYLLGELFNTTPGLRRMLIEPEDDGEEHFVDADKVKKVVEEEESKGESSKFTTYDGRKREPLYAHADTSCLWELVPFLNHFHPSVSLQASQLLMGQPITGSPDISLNTLISFLDKFVYRNPKKTAQPKGASIMQPAAITDQSGVVRTRGPRTDESAFVNSEAFWRKKVEDVPVDQMFFHKFFSTKLAKKDAANKKKSGKADSDAEDSDMDMGSDDGSAPELPSEIGDETDGEGSDDEMASDPEEDEIWKAMKASMPEVGDDMGLSEDDSSDDDVDVDYSDDEDEAGEGEGEEDDEDEDEAASDADSDSSGGSFPSFDDDEDDLISMDEMDDVVLGGDESEPEVEEDAEAGAKRKRREERKERKKKRKEMPAFASYEDYAALIEQAGDDQDE
jgi:ribosome biogenesis protein MAK21